MGKAVDVIIVADSTRFDLRQMTRNCVRSCWMSEQRVDMNIIVVDGNKRSQGFEFTKTVTYDFEFNYNKCLNTGLAYGSAPYVAFCNNDLFFHKEWFTKTIKAMGGEFHSASPYKYAWRAELARKEGYEVKKEVLGWCLVAKRSMIDKLVSPYGTVGKIDEDVTFWYSDNVYIEQVRRSGFRHCLVYGAHVTHLGSRTLFKRGGSSKGITRGQRAAYDAYMEKWTSF